MSNLLAKAGAGVRVAEIAVQRSTASPRIKTAEQNRVAVTGRCREQGNRTNLRVAADQLQSHCIQQVRTGLVISGGVDCQKISYWLAAPVGVSVSVYVEPKQLPQLAPPIVPALATADTVRSAAVQSEIVRVFIVFTFLNAVRVGRNPKHTLSGDNPRA